MRLSDEQRRVLKALRKRPANAKELRTGVRTFISLSKNRLIFVPTTFDNAAFPQRAVATITPIGLEAITR